MAEVTLQLQSPKYQNSLAEFIETISTECSGGDWLFRGQGIDTAWPVPRIARGMAAKSDPAKLEQKLLDEFLQKLPSVYSKPVPSNWKALALLQHYGGVTRLLDWSRNPLVALWFALNAYVSKPRRARHASGPVVWAVKARVEDWLDIRLSKEIINNIRTVRFLSPPHFDGRISAQESVFSAHPLPRSTLDNLQAGNYWQDDSASARKMFRLNISPEKSDETYSQVELCGFRPDTIYPDIQGLCMQLAEQYGRAKSSALIGASRGLPYTKSKKLT